jgi:hypothetical protein
MTLALGDDSFLRASRERLAFSSCRKPTSPFRRTMARMAAASVHSPRAPAMIADATRIQITSWLIWPQSLSQRDVSGASDSLFGPSAPSLSAASAAVSPRVRSLRSRRMASAEVQA